MRGRNSVPGSGLPPDSAERTTSTTEYLNGKDCDCRKAVAVFPAFRGTKGAIEWMSESNLMRVSYQDAAQGIRLSAYADVVIYEPIGQRKILRAVRLGGYPEMTHGLADAIFGGGNLEVQAGEHFLPIETLAKRYQRQFSHDGVYAEATLLSLDDERDAQEAHGEDEAAEPRKCVIFCPPGDRQRLFEEVDRKTAVPLIPEFQDYLLDELERRKILRKLKVLSLRERIDAWVLECQQDDRNIIEAVEDGLRSGAIAIPGEVRNPDGFDGISNVTGYLTAFGVTVAERIRQQFIPLFDPAAEQLSREVLAVNSYIQAHAGYPLYNAQLAVAEAVKRKLLISKFAFIVAECGAGKTKIGAAAMAATISALRIDPGRREKTFNLVLCPAHVAEKWTREIAETLPDAVGVVVRSNAELDRLYTQFQQGEQSVYAIISKEIARDGYMKRPAVRWNRRRGAFTCPSCDADIETPISEDGVHYRVRAKSPFFRTETARNHKCAACGELLWTAVDPHRQSDWVKIGGYGWVFRSLAWEHVEKTRNAAVRERLREIQQDPNANYPTVGASHRYPMSSYIKRRYKGRVNGLIVDELHQYNNDSGQGDAMAELAATAKKVIGMTATLINGYSSGIFHLLYRFLPEQMRKDDKPYGNPGEFDREYGVVETTYEEADPDYAANRRASKSKKRTRLLPGVSPLVYSRFLLEHTAFLSLSDMGKELPDYEEIPVPLNMSKETGTEYRRIEKQLVEVMRSDKAAAKKILSTYLNLLTVYPDQPYGQPEVLHPVTGKPIVTPQDTGDSTMIAEKERTVLDLVEQKIQKGEKVLVYTSWVRTDSQQKLLRLLRERGFRADILSETVRASEREAWVEKRLATGLQVLITNPSLVETGLDLNAFTTLIFFSLGYKLFTLRQAARRSWRINQRAPRVEVYLLYYRDTMQQKAIKLMASKLAVAGIIEGNFSEEGLAAMSDVQDMTSQMAKELMLGIRDSVEDIAGSFRKMAVIGRHTREESSFAAVCPKEGMKEKAPKRRRPVRINEDQIVIAGFAA